MRKAAGSGSRSGDVPPPEGPAGAGAEPSGEAARRPRIPSRSGGAASTRPWRQNREQRYIWQTRKSKHCSRAMRPPPNRCIADCTSAGYRPGCTSAGRASHRYCKPCRAACSTTRRKWNAWWCGTRSSWKSTLAGLCSMRRSSSSRIRRYGDPSGWAAATSRTNRTASSPCASGSSNTASRNRIMSRTRRRRWPPGKALKFR